MRRCGIARKNISAVSQQLVAAHAKGLGQLGDLIIRYEPSALFNAQNGHFVHFHSGKLHACGQLTLRQVLADAQVAQTTPDQVFGIAVPIDFHDPSPQFWRHIFPKSLIYFLRADTAKDETVG